VRSVAQAAGLVALFVAAFPGGGSAQTASGDTVLYRDAATGALVARARARHLRQDSLVHDYQADVLTRVDLSVGRSRFSSQRPLVVQETRARVTWRHPNDMRVEVLGKRGKSVFGGSRGDRVDLDAEDAAAGSDAEVEVSFEERPWFVPRALGDSIRLLGLPETAALHPLSPGAERWYAYAIQDSVTIEMAGRTLRAIGIRVVPRASGASLVAGDLWVDATTADVVRIMVTFVGDYVWGAPEGETARDSADARSDTRRAQRFLTVDADLEYVLVDDKYWMPYRQLLALTGEVDFLVRGAAPLRFVTTFGGYRVNSDPTFAFVAQLDSTDTLSTGGRTYCPACTPEQKSRRDRAAVGYMRTGSWADGRWEVQVPPADSLREFAWRDSLAFELDPAEAERIRGAVAALGRLEEQLPGEMVGRSAVGIAWDQVGGIARFNRVQGLSLGAGVRLRPGPAFSSLDLAARFGFADERVTGSATWRRDAPDGLLEVSGFRSVLEAEPWTRGQSLGNTLNAMFTAHDDADYHLAEWGGSLGYMPYTGPFEDVEFRLAVERHASMEAVASSGVNDFLGGDGIMPANPAVTPGTFARLSVRPHRRIGRVELHLGAEVLSSDSLIAGRAWASADLPFRALDRRGLLTLRAGYGVGDSLPQVRFRAGGPWSVRGYDYGSRQGVGAWSVQLEQSLTRSWLAAPFVFADVGDTFRDASFDPFVGLGGGVSFLGGMVRLNGAWGVNPETTFRFDLLFRPLR
jgi:hypothetical protein